MVLAMTQDSQDYLAFLDDFDTTNLDFDKIGRLAVASALVSKDEVGRLEVDEEGHATLESPLNLMIKVHRLKLDICCVSIVEDDGTRFWVGRCCPPPFPERPN
jgi:hypothetical protein